MAGLDAGQLTQEHATWCGIDGGNGCRPVCTAYVFRNLFAHHFTGRFAGLFAIFLPPCDEHVALPSLSLFILVSIFCRSKFVEYFTCTGLGDNIPWHEDIIFSVCFLAGVVVLGV